jgi:hypothetical protein
VQVAVGGLRADRVVTAKSATAARCRTNRSRSTAWREVAQDAAPSAGTDLDTVGGKQTGDGLGEAGGDAEAAR